MTQIGIQDLKRKLLIFCSGCLSVLLYSLLYRGLNLMYPMDVGGDGHGNYLVQ